jgi:hypothetical protein
VLCALAEEAGLPLLGRVLLFLVESSTASPDRLGVLLPLDLSEVWELEAERVVVVSGTGKSEGSSSVGMGLPDRTGELEINLNRKHKEIPLTTIN